MDLAMAARPRLCPLTPALKARNSANPTTTARAIVTYPNAGLTRRDDNQAAVEEERPGEEGAEMFNLTRRVITPTTPTSYLALDTSNGQVIVVSGGSRSATLPSSSYAPCPLHSP